jgi:phospholipid/cholesterol/gamma-HCH transport system permease protein
VVICNDFVSTEEDSIELTIQAQTDSPSPAPWFHMDKTKNGLLFRLGGAWLFRNVGALESAFQAHFAADIPKKLSVQLSIEKDCIMDSSGACLIAQAIKMLKSQGRAVEVLSNGEYPLLEKFLAFQPAVEQLQPSQSWKTRWLDHIGYRAIVLKKTALSMLEFLGEVLVTWWTTFKSSAHIRWVSVFRQCEEVGVKALPIVGLISFLIGVVLSYQSINQLRRFGAEIYTIDFLGVSILREIAVLLTAIVIAGRSGSAFTAQIGTMGLNQEIDAIRMLGLNPILVLVVPRLLAIIVCLPILVFFAMIMGLLGGMLMTGLIIDVTPLQFANYLQKAISHSAFWVGMSKAPLFAILIGLVGCYRGFQVKGSAESVGRMTTQSVVESIFLVIICDALMSILFSYLKV